MLTKGMKKIIENFITEECDDIIVDIMSKKLNVNITREGDEIAFIVTFAGKTLAHDKINIK